jgi:hypothetical protein
MINVLTCVGFMLFAAGYAVLQMLKLVVRVLNFVGSLALPW